METCVIYIILYIEEKQKEKGVKSIINMIFTYCCCYIVCWLFGFSEFIYFLLILISFRVFFVFLRFTSGVDDDDDGSGSSGLVLL